MIIKMMPGLRTRLRNVSVFKVSATTIDHVAMMPEVQHALGKWIRLKVEEKHRGVLIGGLAMSFYAKPRMTEDVDLLFLHSTDIPDNDQAVGFKRYRPGAFRELDTHVDVKVTSPESFDNLPITVASKVISTAVERGGIKVASLEGMVALKLCSAFAPKRMSKDRADIVALLQNDLDLNLKDWPLEPRHRTLLEDVRAEAMQ